MNTFWHSKTIGECLDMLNTDLDGLSQQESERRIKHYGINELPENHQRRLWQRWFEQFNNFLIYILLIAAIINLYLGQKIDSLVILGVVFLNAVIGFIQEGKAIRAIQALNKVLSRVTTVLRDQHKIALATKYLVPGDIVLLKSGNKIPADLRLIETNNLQVDEAILTGESLPVEKNENAVSEQTILSDRTCMAYSGTLVLYGTGIGVVTATGKETEIGRISSLISQEKRFETPLLRQISIFGHWLVAVIISLSLILLLFGVIVREYPLADMFMATVAITVSVIPEGLPAIVTIIMAVGVTRMAQRHAITKRLAAVEVLSCVDVICTDKTGTLTKNELTVTTIITNDDHYDVTGTGYNDEGEILRGNDSFKGNFPVSLEKLLDAAVLCTEGSLIRRDNEWHLTGSPIDGALLSLGLKGKKSHQKLTNLFSQVALIPFESSNKYMATLIQSETESLIFVKGAPEKILKKSDFVQTNKGLQPLDKSYWMRKISSLAGTGMRVLALAYKKDNPHLKALTHQALDAEFVFLGIVGMTDPSRREAFDSIQNCLKAGIMVKIITGDHVLTAQNIARQVGFPSTRTFTGEQIDQLDDAALISEIDQIDIFARTVPEHKVRIIQALQARDKIVAMTGDGINDAPALKNADVGIAMGIKGTDVAHEAAEIILADDNFSSIEQAVKEGRNIYNNLKKALLFILPNDGGEGLSIFFAILFGYTLPITPVQILWVNLVTAVTLALALAFESPEPHLMRLKPRKPKEPLLSRFLIWRILFVSSLFVLSMFGLFVYALEQGIDLGLARTMVVNVLVLLEAVYLINCRHIHASVLSRDGIFGSTPVLIAIATVLLLQLAFTYLPVMQHFFHTQALNLTQWGLIFSIAVIVFLVIELEKAIIRKFNHA